MSARDRPNPQVFPPATGPCAPLPPFRDGEHPPLTWKDARTLSYWCDNPWAGGTVAQTEDCGGFHAVFVIGHHDVIRLFYDKTTGALVGTYSLGTPCRGDFLGRSKAASFGRESVRSVSYTHLTLPTSDLV